MGDYGGAKEEKLNERGKSSSRKSTDCVLYKYRSRIIGLGKESRSKFDFNSAMREEKGSNHRLAKVN